MIASISSQIIRLFTLSSIVFICLSSCNPPAQKVKTAPNVLFIAIDDLNDWVGVLGGHPQAYTPNIDRLAVQGTLFTNAHCQAPLCGPSRASLMSGLRPSTTGIYGQINDKNLRKSDERMQEIVFLPQYFREQGYKTMGIGKLFHQHAPAGQFEESGGRVKGFGPKPEMRFKWDQKGTSTDWGAFPEVDSLMPDYQSAQWAIERLNQSHDRPFFLAVGFLRPHVPWYVPPRWFERHPLDKVQTPPYLSTDREDMPTIAQQVAEVPMMPTTEWAIESGEWPAICQAYLASVSFVDHYVGQVLDALEKSEFADNTLIILWSDHGYHIGEKNRFAKHSLWEEATRVPLIIAGPNLPARQISGAPVELLDLYPTLLDLCGLPPYSENEGRSLKPLLQDPETEWPHAAITTYGRNNHAIRTQDYRMISYEDNSFELYDHRSDPNEWNNLANSPSETQAILPALQSHIPNQNSLWSPQSGYDVIPYFAKQNAEQSR